VYVCVCVYLTCAETGGTPPPPLLLRLAPVLSPMREVEAETGRSPAENKKKKIVNQGEREGGGGGVT